jgi:ribosomal protein L29
VNINERARLHGLKKDELEKELAEAERDLIGFRFDAGLNRLTNPAALHKSRKRIAVLKTLIRQQELLAESGFTTMPEYQAYRMAERRAHKAARKAR